MADDLNRWREIADLIADGASGRAAKSAAKALREAADEVVWLRGELAKADAENNAAGRRAKQAEAAVEVYQRWQQRVLKHIPRDDREALTARLAAVDGQARTTTDTRGHARTCPGCTTTLAACREEGGQCCDLCQHQPTTAPTEGDDRG